MAAVCIGVISTVEKRICRWYKALYDSSAVRCVSPEATFLFQLANRASLALEFQEAWEPYLMRL